MAARAPRRTPSRRGFTIVELLIVVAVTTAGFIALADLQTSSLRGMRSMSRMADALALGENFLEDLRLEFSQWTPETSLEVLASAGKLPHLAGLPTGAAAQAGAQTPGDGVVGGPGWVIGDEDGGVDRRVGVVGDLSAFPPSPVSPAAPTNAGALAATTDPNVPGGAQPFCLLYRLTWLVPQRAFRAEVEVQWPLDTANMTNFAKCDTIAASRLDEVRSVTLTTTISANLFRR